MCAAYSGQDQLGSIASSTLLGPRWPGPTQARTCPGHHSQHHFLLAVETPLTRTAFPHTLHPSTPPSLPPLRLTSVSLPPSLPPSQKMVTSSSLASAHFLPRPPAPRPSPLHPYPPFRGHPPKCGRLPECGGPSNFFVFEFFQIRISTLSPVARMRTALSCGHLTPFCSSFWPHHLLILSLLPLPSARGSWPKLVIVVYKDVLTSCRDVCSVIISTTLLFEYRFIGPHLLSTIQAMPPSQRRFNFPHHIACSLLSTFQ